MAETRKLTVRCPDCAAELVVDAETGTILSHRTPKAPLAGGHSFDSLFAELDSGKARAEELFEREKAALADRDRLLDEKFREALKRAEEEPDLPPKRPFDLD
ncbi:MAG: hypothetical protein F9K16_10780 [Thermoanaerobaculia bacterium]|nr:MAG: hypothetical protein F9K16_10780 [Thermoanaerobaculia bacterium]MBZ0100968.1 hypothetical protein [Thermoanaerobaculia bacterium]